MNTTVTSPRGTNFYSWRAKADSLLFVLLLALAATQAAQLAWLRDLGISPLIVAIVLGAAYSNLMPGGLPADWADGVSLAARRLLRIAIAFYGLRLSVQEVMSVGIAGFGVATVMVLGTLALGVGLGRVLRIDRETALLTAAGSAICGAAAVLAFESIVRSAPHKSSVAVATVVLFGTLSMFLYPLMYHVGWFSLNEAALGIFLGASVHEVAQVVAAASAIDPAVIHAATIVKMVRVALLVPLLLMLGFWLARQLPAGSGSRGRIPVPWFVLGFLALVVINSLDILPAAWVVNINMIDTFALTMAMAALGLETRVARMRQAGLRVLVLALLLFVWLWVGGYGMTLWASRWL